MLITIGSKYGRLTVIESAGKNKQGRLLWRCACICGNLTIVSGTKLRCGVTQSCGCLARELASERATTHGESKSITYSSWVAMVHRCTDPKRKDFPYYGGRGITVCDRWREYGAFLSDMGERPDKNHTIDRIDSNKGYDAHNCRWATFKSQANNTRRNIKLTLNGQTKTLAEWAETTDTPYTTLQWRVHAGWNDHDVLFGR